MEFIIIFAFIIFVFLIFYFSFRIVALYDFFDFEEVLNCIGIVIDDNCKLFFGEHYQKKKRGN